MKYRYIISPQCRPEDAICAFRLISHRVIGLVAKEPGRTYYRVHIPEDLKLEKYSCDEYATTEDKRTLAELGCDAVMTMWDGSRKLVPQGVDVEALSKEQFRKWVQSLSAEKPLEEKLQEAQEQANCAVVGSKSEREKEGLF